MTGMTAARVDVRYPLAIATALLVAGTAALPQGWGGVMTVSWVLGAIACWYRPTAGLAVIALVTPFQDQFTVPTLIGDVLVTRFVAGALIVAFVAMVASGTSVVVDRVAMMYLLVIVTLVASYAAGDVRLYTWFQEIYRWSLPLVIYVICRSLRWSLRDRLLVVVSIAAVIIVNGLEGVHQVMTGAGPESFQVNGLVRIFGTFMHPNTLAAFLGITLPLVLAVGATRMDNLCSPARWIVRVGAVLGVAALLLTQSRGGWLAVGCAMIFLVLMAPRLVQRWVVTGAVCLGLALVAGGVATGVPGLERFAGIVSPERQQVQVTRETWGQLEREAHWGAAWAMMKEHPLFGVGAAEFNDNYREYTPTWRFRVGRGHAHNGMLHMGAQAGLPGAIALVVWLGTVLAALARRINAVRGYDLALAIGAAGCAIAYSAHSAVEYLGEHGLPVMLAIVVALGLGGVPVTPSPTREPASRAETGQAT